MNLKLFSLLLPLYFSALYGQSIQIDNYNVIRIGEGTLYTMHSDTDGNLFTISETVDSLNPRLDKGRMLITSSPKEGGIFICKYNKNKHFLWAKKVIAWNVKSVSMVTDSKGNIYVQLYSPSTIYPNEADSSDWFRGDKGTLLIAKYDADGNYIWGKYASGRCEVGSRCFIRNDKLILIGNYSTQITMDPEGKNIYKYASYLGWSYSSIYLMQYNLDGKFLNAKAIRGGRDLAINEIQQKSDGSFYFWGNWTDTLFFEEPNGKTGYTYYQSHRPVFFSLDSNLYLDTIYDFKPNINGSVILRSIIEEDSGYQTWEGAYREALYLKGDTGEIRFPYSLSNYKSFIWRQNPKGEILWYYIFTADGQFVYNIKMMSSNGKNYYHLNSGNQVTKSNGKALLDKYGNNVQNGLLSFDRVSGKVKVEWNYQLKSGSRLFPYVLKVGSRSWIFYMNYKDSLNVSTNRKKIRIGPDAKNKSILFSVNSSLNSFYDTLRMAYCDSVYDPLNQAMVYDNICYDVRRESENIDTTITYEFLKKDVSFIELNKRVCSFYINPGTGKVHDSSGNYRILLKNSYGCDSIVDLKLNVTKLDRAIERNQDTLSVLYQDSTKYQWYICNNTPIKISGETNHFFSPATNGSYLVVVSKNQCIDTSDCFAFNNVNVNNINNLYCEIHPNPNSGQFSIEFPKPMDIIYVKIYSYDGRLIEKRTLAGGLMKYAINSNLSSGVYFIQVSNNISSCSKKVIVW